MQEESILSAALASIITYLVQVIVAKVFGKSAPGTQPKPSPSPLPVPDQGPPLGPLGLPAPDGKGAFLRALPGALIALFLKLQSGGVLTREEQEVAKAATLVHQEATRSTGMPTERL